MTVSINFIKRKTLKQTVWKTLNVVVGITTILNVSLIGALIKPNIVHAAGYTLEGQRKDLTFTPGNICSGGGACYAEGENVPFRLTIDGLTNGNTYTAKINHDYKDSAGVEGYVNFNTPGAWDSSATGVSLSAPTTSGGLPNTKTYSITFTVASVSGTVHLKWLALLGQDAGEWNGAQLHARLVEGVNQETIGNKEVPINPDKIIIRNLTIRKTDNPDPINLNANTTYTLLVGNTGEQAETATVVDTLPAQMTYVPGSASLVPTSVVGNVITWSGIALAKTNGSTTITFQAKGTEVGTWTNTASVSAAGLTPVTDTENTTVLGQCALTVDKFVKSGDQWVKTPTTANPGDTLYYKIVVTNTGTADCTGGGIIVQDINIDTQLGTPVDGTLVHADPGYEFTSPPTPWWDSTTRTLTWNAHTLHSGESATIEWSAPVNVTACGDFTIKNKAKATPAEIPAGIWSNEVTTTGTKVCTGHLIVDKVTNPSDDPQGFNFDASGGSYSDFTLTDAQVPNDQALVAGTYSVSETVPSGWDQTSATCSDGSPVNAIVLSADETVTCTFTNTKKGHLIVQKTTDPAADPTVFSISASGDGAITGGGAGTVTDALDKNYEVTAGTYSVTETQPTGWSKNDNDCQSVAVAAGETKYCTITNTRDTGFLTVNKMVDPENDGSFVGVGGDDTPFRWGVDALDGPTTPRYMGATATGIPTVTPFNVNENLSDVPDYHFAGWYYTDDAAQLDNNRTYNCTNPQFTSMPTGLTVAKNGPTQITLCNARDTGNLTVIKAVDTDGDGLVDQTNAGDWTWDLDAVNQNFPTGSTQPVITGEHVVSEDNKDNFHNLSYVCRNNETEDVVAEGTGTTIPAVNVTTDGVTCTFTNVRDTGRVTFDKVVTENPSAESLFAFAVNGSGSYHDGDAVSLPTGSYTVTESAVPGYAFVSASGICALVEGAIVMNVTTDGGSCTITNRQLFPDLTVTKTDGLITASAGQQLTYTMVISNVGEFTADNVTANDTLPAQATYVSSTLDGVNAPATVTPNPSGDQLNWNIGSLANGASKTLLVTVTLDATFPFGTTPLHNVVSVATTTTEPNTSNNSASDDTNVSASPILGLQKSASPTVVPAGTNINWTVKWSVSGNANATNVVITDPIPANSTFVSVADGGVYDAVTNRITWSLGTQAPGASGEVHYVAKAASPIANGTVVTNTATIDSAETDPAISASASVTVTSAPDLTITKTTDLTTFTNPGKVVNYTVVVTNKATATDTAKNVIITDTLPAGFTFAVDGTSTKTFSVGDLAPGASNTVTFLVNISGTQTAGTYTNTAKAKGDNTTEVTATAPVEVRVPQVLAAATPDLAISKVVNKSTAKPGDVVTYTITVKNTGDGDATNVVITDTLPKDLSFVHGTGRTMTWKIGTLEAGRSRVVNVDVRVESDAKAGDYENVAAVTADDLPQQQATAKLTVKTPKVLGLATTGTGPLDYFLALLGAALIWAGLLGLKRRQPELAQ